MTPTLARFSVSCLLLLAIHFATASAGWNTNVASMPGRSSPRVPGFTFIP